MTLLLLLSAMLSALTGAGGGVRAPLPPVAVRAATVAAAARTVAVAASGRPVAALPTRIAVAGAPALPRWRLTASAPIYLARRRE